MKTKEKKLKPTKKTDDKKEEKTIQQTEQINKNETDILKKEEEQKIPYMPKVETMQLIMSILYDTDKNTPRNGIDNTIDKNTCEYIDPNMEETIQRYTIPFSEKEIMKIILAPDFVCDDKIDDVTKQPNIEAERAEMSYNKMMFGYNFLSKNKEYSLLNFCNDMKEIGCHFDLRTQGERLFDYEKYIKDIELEDSLGDDISTYRLSVNTLLNTKGFYIVVKDKDKLKKCLERYIGFFIEDKLSQKEIVNVYTYKAHLKKAVEFFQEDYENCGKMLTIDCEEYKNKDKRFRLIECMLALEQQGYIKINNFFYIKDDLKILITFLKNPKAILNEIETLEKKHNRWIEYGDLKVDKDLGLAQYKDNPKKLNKNSNEFKVLCYLIEHPNKVIHIDKLIEVTKLNNDFKKYKKVGRPSKEIKAKMLEETDFYMGKIKGYTIEVQDKLGITKDEKRTIQISQSKPGFILHKM